MLIQLIIIGFGINVDIIAVVIVIIDLSWVTLA